MLIISQFTGKEIVESCPKCVEEQKAREEREAEESLRRIKQKAVQMLRSRCGVPPRFQDKTLETIKSSPKLKPILKAVKNYQVALLSGTSASLIMCGKPGTGKTHIGCALVSALVDNMKSAEIVTTVNLMRRVKTTWGKNSETSEDEVLEGLENLRLLVIDEVGVQFGTETEKMIFHEIIDRRYNNMQPTVLISNLPADELKDFIGERAFDRFREDGGAILAFDWESYRR